MSDKKCEGDDGARRQALEKMLARGTPDLATFNLPAVSEFLGAQRQIAVRKRLALWVMVVAVLLLAMMYWLTGSQSDPGDQPAAVFEGLIVWLCGAVAVLALGKYVAGDIRLLTEDGRLAGLIDNPVHLASIRRFARTLRLRVYWGPVAPWVLGRRPWTG